jgi:hypothetical protein
VGVGRIMRATSRAVRRMRWSIQTTGSGTREAGGPRWCDIGRLQLGGQDAVATCRSLSSGAGACWSGRTGKKIRRWWKTCRKRGDAVKEGVGLRRRRVGQGRNAVAEFDERGGIKPLEGLPDPARRPGRRQVGRPARQGERASIRVGHHDLHDVVHPPHVADRQGVAVQRMNGVEDGDTA